MGTRKLKKTQRQPLFDWTRDGLTQSALTQWLQCREQFSLNYVEGYTSRGFNTALEFGTIIHLAIQRQDEIGKGRTTAYDLIADICESYHNARYPQLQGHYDKQTCSKTLAAAEALFPLYHKNVEEDDAKQDWVAREQMFAVPYQIPLAGGLGNAEITLRGMRDGTYRTKRKGLLGLFETKTRSHIDDNAIATGLRADLQTMFYLLTLQREYNETPKEVLYNVIRRPGQKYLDRDTFKSFKERITKDIQDRPSYYFRRWELSVLESDLKSFQQTVLDPALRVMLDWWESVKTDPFDRFKSPYHYVNLNALYTKYGPAPLYSLMVLGRKQDYYVRSSVFPELENEPSPPTKKAS